MMFKILILQAQHNLSDARTEYMIRDRLSWMRFLGFALGDRTPDENTIRHFRNRMTETGTLKRVLKAFDWQLHKKGGILCREIGRASCRERVCQYGWVSVVAVALKKQQENKR